MEDEAFYESITKQIDDAECKLSALDKILKAFEEKEKALIKEKENLLTDNQKNTKP